MDICELSLCNAVQLWCHMQARRNFNTTPDESGTSTLTLQGGARQSHGQALLLQSEFEHFSKRKTMKNPADCSQKTNMCSRLHRTAGPDSFGKAAQADTVCCLLNFWVLLQLLALTFHSDSDSGYTGNLQALYGKKVAELRKLLHRKP